MAQTALQIAEERLATYLAAEKRIALNLTTHAEECARLTGSDCSPTP